MDLRAVGTGWIVEKALVRGTIENEGVDQI